MITRRELLKTAGILTTIPMVVPTIGIPEIIDNSLGSKGNIIKGTSKNCFFLNPLFIEIFF